MSTTVDQVGIRPKYDPYRFGNGAEPVLQPGTIGWSVADLDDSLIRSLFHDGRFEIIEGVLTTIPPALFRGGEAPDNVVFIVRTYLRKSGIRARFAGETDIQIDQDRLLRADAVGVFGDNLPKFEALVFHDGEPDWRDHPLIIPPTLVIESVSQGHEKHDRQTKRRWYAELGVPNYWIVDPFKKTLDCLILHGRIYRDGGHGEGAGIVRPAVFVGLEIPLAEVWDD